MNENNLYKLEPIEIGKQGLNHRDIVIRNIKDESNNIVKVEVGNLITCNGYVTRVMEVNKYIVLRLLVLGIDNFIPYNEMIKKQWKIK